MPRKKKSSTPRRKKAPSHEEQILDAAEAAGAQYAQDQVESAHFRDWLYEQMVEGERMRRADPNSVIPLETKSDYKKLARNMLQQLSWDTKRELDTHTILELTGASSEIGADTWERAAHKIGLDVVNAFYKGFNENLSSMVDWLAEEAEAINEGLRETGTKEPRHVRSGIGDRQRTAGDLEFRVVIRGTSKPLRVWAPNLKMAQRIAAGQAYATRTEVVSVEHVGNITERSSVRSVTEAGREIQHELWLCEDCTIAEVNGDYSGMSEERAAEVEKGIERLVARVGPISSNWNSETEDGIQDFSSRPCNACGTRLAGSRHRFASFGLTEALRPIVRQVRTGHMARHYKGMSFEDWLRAARHGHGSHIRDNSIARRAFAHGIDPAEFAETYAGGFALEERSGSRVGDAKRRAAFARLDHFFGSPSAQKKGFKSDDEAAFSAATLLASQIRVPFGTALLLVKEWYARGETMREASHDLDPSKPLESNAVAYFTVGGDERDGDPESVALQKGDVPVQAVMRYLNKRLNGSTQPGHHPDEIIVQPSLQSRSSLLSLFTQSRE